MSLLRLLLLVRGSRGAAPWVSYEYGLSSIHSWCKIFEINTSPWDAMRSTLPLIKGPCSGTGGAPAGRVYVGTCRAEASVLVDKTGHHRMFNSSELILAPYGVTLTIHSSGPGGRHRLCWMGIRDETADWLRGSRLEDCLVWFGLVWLVGIVEEGRDSHHGMGLAQLGDM